MNELIRTGPSINKGKSRQDYATPIEFIYAVTNRFGPITFDLASSSDNYKGPEGCLFTESDDSLSQDWTKLKGNLWCNPPYGVIGPWARKCAQSITEDEDGWISRRIFLLTPASVGSNWFAEYVHNRALVLFLRPRLTFEGADDPYPKDLLLAVYGLKTFPSGYQCWRWDTP